MEHSGRIAPIYLLVFKLITGTVRNLVDSSKADSPSAIPFARRDSGELLRDGSDTGSIGGDMRGDLTSGLLLVFLGGLASVAAAAGDLDTPEPAPAAFANKLTMAGYAFSSGTFGFDANLRHTFATTTAWLGTYHESD